MTITYLTGDATQPVKKPALIIHVCNDIGGWGRGFVLALSKRWPEPEAAYRRLAGSLALGEAAYPVVECHGTSVQIVIANMIAQHGVSSDSNGTPPIRYEALAQCLQNVRQYTRHFARWGEEITIHAPRIGCGLAGGSWSVVAPLIDFYLQDREVYIYDLPGASGG